MQFDFTKKPPIFFGPGSVSLVGEKAKSFGWNKVILIFDKGVKAVGIVDKVTASLDSASVEYVEFDKVLPDPADVIIEEAAEIARNEKVDGVIAVGGGSPLDVGKCVSILLTNPPPLSNYFGMNFDLNPVPGSILITTNAGTGSEVSDTAIVTDTANNVKLGIVGEFSKAKLALVDPELTYGLPASLTAVGALDAFAHGFESFTGTGNNPFTELYAQKSMKLIVQNLPIAIQNPGNVIARTNLSLAATMAGMAFGDAMVHLGHNVGQNVSALAHLPHGTSCMLGLLAIIEFITDAVPEKIRWVGELFGLDSCAQLTNEELGKEVASRFKSFCESVGAPTSLSAAGVDEAILEDAANLIGADPVLQLFTPKKLSAEKALELLKRVY